MLQYTGRVEYANQRKIRARNKFWYRVAHWPIWIWVFFVAPGPLTFDLFAKGPGVRNLLWLVAVAVGTGTAGLLGQLPGVEARPYILRFCEDKPNPLYRTSLLYVCLECAIEFRASESRGSDGSGANGPLASATDLHLRLFSRLSDRNERRFVCGSAARSPVHFGGRRRAPLFLRRGVVHHSRADDPADPVEDNAAWARRRYSQARILCSGSLRGGRGCGTRAAAADTADSSRRSHGCRLILAFCIGLASVFVALLGAGIVYQQLGERRDRKRFPPRGRMIPVNGCSLHLTEQGSGGPAVILEAGIAASSLSWSSVQLLIAGFTRVASYDRAGLGWSEPCSEARSLRAFTRQLSILLGKAQIAPPYVLVGHSFGGLLIRAFACENPSQVAGLVFVDPVSLQAWANCPEEDRRRLNFGVKLSQRGAWLARLGVVRFALAAATMRGQRVTRFITKASAGRATPFLARLVGEIRKLPPAVLPVVTAQWCRAKGFDAMAEHLAALPRCAQEASGLRLPPEIPFIVLSAATATQEELRERDSWVRESPRGRHRRIENTGHWLQLERPDAVVCAVKEIIEEYRSG